MMSGPFKYIIAGLIAAPVIYFAATHFFFKPPELETACEALKIKLYTELQYAKKQWKKEQNIFWEKATDKIKGNEKSQQQQVARWARNRNCVQQAWHVLTLGLNLGSDETRQMCNHGYTSPDLKHCLNVCEFTKEKCQHELVRFKRFKREIVLRYPE